VLFPAIDRFYDAKEREIEICVVAMQPKRRKSSNDE